MKTWKCWTAGDVPERKQRYTGRYETVHRKARKRAVKYNCTSYVYEGRPPFLMAGWYDEHGQWCPFEPTR